MRKIIAIQIKKEKNTYYLFDSEGNKVQGDNPQTIFEFLLKGAEQTDTFHILWNIYTLVDLIGHIIPKNAYETLLSKDRVELTYDRHTYRLFSSQGRMFAITHKWYEVTHANFQNKYEEEVNFYHLAQFFPDEHYETVEDIKRKGEELLIALDEMGFHPTKLSSAVAIYDEKLKDLYVPRMLDLDDDGLDFCDFCEPLLSREWRSVYKIGHWEKAYQFDVRSGYPSIIKDFKDTNICYFWKAKTLQKCDFGIIKGTVNITNDYSPIVDRNGCNRKGRYTDYFTTPQIGFIHYFNQGVLENIEEARYLKFLSNDKPFEKTMIGLYHDRQQGGAKRNFCKSVSVGIGGKYSQQYDGKLGEYYNPIYSLMMSSGMSIHVGKFILNNHLETNLIDVVVDGFCSDKLVTVEDNNEIGDWRVEEVKALIISLGSRYITNLSDVNKKDSHLNDYTKMVEAIQAHPYKKFYNNILLNKNLMNTNRNFKQFPKTGKDLLDNIYTSEAISV